MPHSIHFGAGALRPVFASVQVHSIPPRGGSHSALATPFITVSRQAGAGAKSSAELLISRLNAVEAQRAHIAPDVTPAEKPPHWTAWDRELVEKIAADLGTSQELIDHLTDVNRGWLDRFFDDVSSAYASYHASEFKIYRRVATTIRALAQAGRSIIVGRGGVYLTRDMPGGLHIRLVAPLTDRIAAIEKRMGLSHKKAEEYVMTTDRARDAFCHQHFPGALFAPEAFSITFNTSAVSVEQMIDCIVDCVYKQPAPIP